MTRMIRSRFEHPNLASVGMFGMEAKPCPFCKSNRLAVAVTHEAHVSCMNCGADGPRIERGHDPREAIDLWNNR